MTRSDLQSMTVVQLRKLARENHIVLGSGTEKAKIIDKIMAALPDASETEAVATPSEAAAEASFTEDSLRDLASSDTQPASAVPDKVPGTEDAEAENVQSSREAPRFQAAWHSPDSPHSGTHSSVGNQRLAWQSTTPSGRPLLSDQRGQPALRPHSFGPRFGPGSSQDSKNPPASVQEHEAPKPLVSPLPDHRIGFASGGTFGPASSTLAATSVPVPSSEINTESSLPESSASSAPTLEELLEAGDFEEGSGILELHPDGYGFLRASNFMPSSRDIYVSMAQIRRFSLRTGDYIQGKIRPQREGDKYAALLYIDAVNGLSEEESMQRPHFDELTPVYPTRRISLESRSGASLPDMRLIDLIAPLGFGQRGLLLCPPDTGKIELLKHYANTISENYPDVSILTLLLDLAPEDVTAFRESVSCPVLASTFDLAPEAHLRLTEMVIERAMRLVEQKKDVVILADSLTRLAKIYSSTAVQQGRSVPGMVNPASLLRAKRMFGAARSLKEGGSLTVIATMDIASGNKVDDSVVEEFKGTANMELMLDQSLVRAGIHPPIQLQRSFTKNSDLLLNDQQKEGLNLIRQMLRSSTSAAAIAQLLSMMEKTASIVELLNKIKDWFALMNM